MERTGAADARRHLPRLLDRVTRGESLTITRHGSPVARLAPVTGDRDHAKEASARILERRMHLKRAPLAGEFTKGVRIDAQPAPDRKLTSPHKAAFANDGGDRVATARSLGAICGRWLSS